MTAWTLILVVVSLAGCELVARKRRLGWILWAATNAGWIVWALASGVPWQALLWVAYLARSVRGWLRWRRDARGRLSVQETMIADALRRRDR